MSVDSATRGVAGRARKARLHADWAVACLGGAAVGVDGADVVRETASIGNF